jgi:hypothetical protein
VLLGWVWLVAATLLLVVPDTRLLTITGYVPILIVGFPFGYPPVDYSVIFTWTLGNQVFAVAGGLLLGRAATYVAAVIPLFYAVIRLAWAAGVPLGITPEFLDELRRTGLVWAGLGWGCSPSPARSSRSAWCSAGARCSRAGWWVWPAGGYRSGSPRSRPHSSRSSWAPPRWRRWPSRAPGGTPSRRTAWPPHRG